MTPLVLRQVPASVYLDSATYGLPPMVALQALSGVTAASSSARNTSHGARDRMSDRQRV